jgi:hypothetical protein
MASSSSESMLLASIASVGGGASALPMSNNCWMAISMLPSWMARTEASTSSS